MRTTVSVLIAAAVGAACGRGEPGPGHRRMVTTLAELARQGAPDNPYFGTGRLQKLHQELEQRGAAAPWRLLLGTAEQELNQGNTRRAIELLTRAHESLRRGEARGDVAAEVGIPFHLGVAWMRLGETENCCARPTAETCILPIRGGGQHTQPEGSRHAIECFTEVLRATPPTDYWHFAAMWLLNVAHMTLGSWPDGVPEPWRMPADVLQPKSDFPRFRNVAADVGLDTFGTAGGALVDDFDGDDWPDVIVSDWAPDGPMHFFHNDQHGGFEERSARAGLPGITGGLNLVHADYDDDGDLDVLVLRGGWWFASGQLPCSLLQNRGDGSFEDVTFAAGLGERREPTQTAAFADFDRDGDLDLYIGGESSERCRCSNHLYRNEGDGTFTDVTAAAGVANERYCKGVTWGDFDGDGWPDLYVSNIGGDNRLYHNRGDGTFVDVAAKAGVTGPRMSFPTWFWDFDNDGAEDLFVAHYQTGVAHIASFLKGGPLPFERLRLYRGDGKGGFRDVAVDAGMSWPCMPMGSNFGDLDNDGWLDCYLGTGNPDYANLMPNVMFRNVGGTRFENVTFAGGFGHLQKGHGVVFADLDQDGDQDVFETMGGAYPGDAFRNVLFENPGFGNRWLTVHSIGTASPRCAIGARLCVTIREAGGTRRVFRTVNSGGSFGGNPLRQTLGLGAATAIERLEITWPRTGTVQTWQALPLDTTIRVREGEPGFEVVTTQPTRFRRR